MPKQAIIVTTTSLPYEILMDTNALYITRRVNMFKALTSFEQSNLYAIYAADETTMEKGSGYALFFAEETSTFWGRACCGPDREFSMTIFQRHPTDEKAKGPDLLTIQRPLKVCSGPCWNRPVMYVRDPDGNLLGEVIKPFRCCELRLTCRAPQVDGSVLPAMISEGNLGSEWFHLVGGKCQTGLCCKCPRGACKHVQFDILDAAGAHVGEIVHTWDTCIKTMAADIDSYCIKFPPLAKWYQKATLLAASILMDFIWFESTRGFNQVHK